MNTPIPLVIIGAGGAASEALWLCARLNARTEGPQLEVIAFSDDNPERTGEVVEGIPIAGTVRQIIQKFGGRGIGFHCAIGHNRARQRLCPELESAGFNPISLIDPTAIIAPSATVGAGTYIGPLSIVAPHARVGRHVLINSHVGVGHHAEVADFAQLCPGVRLNGRCKVDTAAFLGSNATVHPGLSIGEGSSIGANSFVIRSVKPRYTMLGVPARIVSRPAENGSDAQP